MQTSAFDIGHDDGDDQMTPRTFVLTAVAAVTTSVAAIAVYAAANPWSQVRATGAKMAPAIASGTPKIGSLVLGQGATALTLMQKDGKWSLKERSGYPVEAEPVRTLLIKLSQAELVEAKTRNPERYALLELEDPAAKDAKSKPLRVLDDKGAVLADVVVGKRKWDAFGSGKGGTYVRTPKDPQVWLANADIDLPLEVRRWIKPDIVALDAGKVSELSLTVAGEEPLELERKDGKSAFKNFPAEGKKLKDANAAEAVMRAAANIDAEDVRKLDATSAGDGVSVLTYKAEAGLGVTLRLRKDGDATWVSVTATGDGASKAAADALNAKAAGWEFKVPPAKAEQLLKKRADLLDAG